MLRRGNIAAWRILLVFWHFPSKRHASAPRE
jgi:hypothetical protein